jgi:DNA-binding LytR/AlgR family response regulator
MIVDDEPLAREVIAGYMRKIDNLELIASCSNAIDAHSMLKEKQIDLIFLDINMPQVSGIDFLKSISRPPKVIVISAHKEYALDGFELDVVDYLLKPVPFHRFLKAVDKYHKTSQIEKADLEAGNEKKYIFLKDSKKTLKVLVDDIEYIEAMAEYCRVYTAYRKLTPKIPLSKLEDELSGSGFMRIHKSYLVPLKKITAFTSTTVEMNNQKELPLGRSYKEAVLKEVQQSIV